MFSWTRPPVRPIIVAHRGSSAHAPENTLAAFRRAVSDGADAVEFDVRMTRDGEIVVIHDSHLRRTAGGAGRVERRSAAELRRLSAGAWFGASFSAERIPTLDEVLEMLPRSIGLNIELKAGLRTRRNPALVERCCAVIRRHRAESRVLFSSFHHPFIRRARRLLPSAAAGLLFHPIRRATAPAVAAARRAGAQYIILGGGTLRKGVVHKAHDRGVCVAEFTVNTPGRFARALRYGIDAVITDDPSSLRALLPGS
jgi:glycerophosphoryl diester phosphodiesterase